MKIGDRVLFTPDKIIQYHNCEGGPYLAMVAKVNDDGSANLAVFDCLGKHHNAVQVPLVTEPPDDGTQFAVALE